MNSKIRMQLFGGMLLVVVFSFGAGFYFGKEGIFFKSIQASEQVDMTPFWKVWNVLNDKFVSSSSTQPISDQDKLYGAISGLVSSLGDPYTVFFTPEEKSEFDESIEGTFEGVGMEVGIRDAVLTVVSPLKNSPAEKAGIQSGDVIMKIDTLDSLTMKVEEAVSKIRGPKGTTVRLTLMRKNQETPIVLDVLRDKIIVPTIETEIINETFVIRLYNFGANSESDFKNAIQQYQKSHKKRLILDLRGNPGGYLDAAVDIASWFLPAGKTVVLEDFGNNTEQKFFRSKGYGLFDTEKNKMIVLINEGSASASEILAGALQEHGIARLVGKKSFGKGSVQELVDITDTTALKVTIAKWLTPNGKSISAGGLTPDIEVEFDVNKFKQHNQDTQLQKALELLK